MTSFYKQIKENPALVPAAVFVASLPFAQTVALRLSCLGLAVMLLLLKSPREKPPTLGFTWVLFFWALLAVSSLLWTQDFTHSLKQIKNEVFYCLITFTLFYSITRDDFAWKVLTRVLVGVFLITALVTLFWHAYSPARLDFEFYRGPGELSTFLVAILPLLLFLYAFFYNRERPSSPAWILVILLFAAAYTTLNRIFWITVLLQVVIFAFLYARSASKVKPIRYGWIMIVLFVALTVTQFFDVARQRAQEQSAQSNVLVATFQDDPRYKLWRFAAEKIAERPWQGFGFGRGILRKDYLAQFGSDTMLHAHNLFLNYGLQLGMLGMITISLLFLAIGREYWLLYRSPSLSGSLIGMFGLCLLIGIVIKNTTDDQFIRQNALLFWAMLGMSLGYAKRKLEHELQ